MRQPLTWIAVALMLTGAVMLVADVGVAGLWIAVITIGIALVAIDGGCPEFRGTSVAAGDHQAAFMVSS
jgi:membrane-bound ClpP family serine protease